AIAGTGAGARTTGPVGPVALWGGVLLLLAAPLLRGGNRHAALIVLEWLALAVLLGLLARRGAASLFDSDSRRGAASGLALALLLTAPLWIAAVQLVPLPSDLWFSLPAHAFYADTLSAVQAGPRGWRPLSVVPDATAASLLAGLPIMAAFLLGWRSSLAQLRVLLGAVVLMAFAQVLLGLMQFASGPGSPLFFGVDTYGPPVGSFANRNHFANYLAMALVALVWLGYESSREARRRGSSSSAGTLHGGHKAMLWAGGALVLLLGILLSLSRGAAVFGLPMAVLAFVAVVLRTQGWTRGWRIAAAASLLLLVLAAGMIGFGTVGARLSGGQLADSAGFRGQLARTSLEGAWAFWPLGAGWGTYDLAYPRFQPAGVAGFANHAHQDYAELLFEGGVFFLLPALAFAWLAAHRVAALARPALRRIPLEREQMAAVLCGLGLLALLLHSLVEFNMRIPANAMLGALLAGAFLRPLPVSGSTARSPA
ncbi:O-antigen ligase family protein, partial [Ramlibacter sp.]|uniref:O-antigen ligase family protein n=1 Tax=Ramlibacter sp. TaxID=1917967 RepID=UPI0025F94115